MGAESGGGGVPRSREISGERPPRNYDISATFFTTRIQFCIILYFENKVVEIRGEN